MKKINVLITYVEEGNQYDLSILNIAMSARFGHKVSARIRKVGYKAPIVGHTGHAHNFAKWYMIQGKMNAMITRPDSGQYLHPVMSEFDLCSNEKSKIRFLPMKKTLLMS